MAQVTGEIALKLRDGDTHELRDASSDDFGTASEETLVEVRDRLPEPVSGRLPVDIGDSIELGEVSIDTTGLASETTAAAILAALADPATETTLAAVLAKLADPASETTLAAVLAKLTADPATATAQGTLHDDLVALLAELGGKLEASDLSGLATSAKQDTLIGLAGTGQGKTLKFATISASSSGQNTIVAGVTSMKLKVASYVIVAEGEVAAKFRSGSSTDLTGAMPLVANAGVSAIGQPSAHLFETAAGQALTLNLSAAVGVRGHVSYFEEA